MMLFDFYLFNDRCPYTFIHALKCDFLKLNPLLITSIKVVKSYNGSLSSKKEKDMRKRVKKRKGYGKEIYGQVAKVAKAELRTCVCE